MRHNSSAHVLITFALSHRRVDQILIIVCDSVLRRSLVGYFIFSVPTPMVYHCPNLIFAAKSELTTSTRRIEIAISMQKLRHIWTQDMIPENSHRTTEALIFIPPTEDVIFSSVVVCLTRCVFIWPEMIAVTWWRHQMVNLSALLTSL